MVGRQGLESWTRLYKPCKSTECTRSRCERWACSRVQPGFDGAPGTQILARGLPPCRQQACARDIRVSPCASHHLGAVRGNPGIVGMLSELGNKVFRHVGLPPEHDFQCGCPLLRRLRMLLFLYPSWDRTPLDMLGAPPVSTLRQRCFS